MATDWAVVTPVAKEWMSPQDSSNDAAAAPPAGRFKRPTASAALLWLLRAAALAADPRRSPCADLLYSLLLFSVDTAAMALAVGAMVKAAIELLAAGTSLAKTVTQTEYMGGVLGVMWVSLTLGVLAGRRGYGRMMLSCERALSRAASLANFSAAASRFGKHAAFLLTFVVTTYLYVTIMRGVSFFVLKERYYETFTLDVLTAISFILLVMKFVSFCCSSSLKSKY